MNYSKIYNDLIKKAKSENRVKGSGVYYESHHITPRCLGGSDDSDNLVNLTAKEHFIAHKLLCEIYPGESKLVYAYWCMSVVVSENRNYRVGSKEFDRIKNLWIEHRTIYDFETALIIAKKYKNKFEFFKNDKGCYMWATKNGFLDKICDHMSKEKWHKWDNESVKKEALRYKTRSTFQKGSRGAYKHAVAYNILDEVCSHMILVRESWTINKVKKIIKDENMTQARELRNKYPGAMRVIWNNKNIEFFPKSKKYKKKEN